MDDTFPEIGDVDISQVVDMGKIIVPEETQNETTPQGKSVESPILMPPPNAIPKAPVLPKKLAQSREHSISAEVMANGGVKSLKKGSIDGHDTNVPIKKVYGKTRVHCSVPSQDVLCFTTNNNTDIDEYTKHLVCEQIKEKILSQKSTRINMRVTPMKSCGDKSVVKQNGKVGNVFKVQRKKFKNKHMTVADIDFEALQTPICCSTPTPSISGSTIVAGHLDVSIIDDIGNELPRRK